MQVLKVLLIEDCEDDALLVLRVLRRGGFDLRWERVETAEDLRSCLISQPWDVIISDHNLPGFDAVAALAIVQQSQLDIPFIVVSGTIGEMAAVEMMRSGAHDYLMKDNLTRLPEAIRREVRDAQVRAERKQITANLAKRDRYLTALVEVQNQLLCASINPAIYDQIVGRLGPIAEADRVYVFENHVDRAGRLLMSQRAEWCAPGVIPQIQNPLLQNLAYDEMSPRWQKILGRGEVIHDIVAELPASERAILEPQEIQTILVIPMVANGEFWGFIGFDNCRQEKRWDTLEVDLLRSAAAAIALAKERQQAIQALAQLNRELEDRVNHRTAALQDSEAKLQAILNFSPAVIYVKDLEGRYMLVNRAFLKLFQVTTEAVLDKTSADLFPADVAAAIESHDQTVIAQGSAQQYEKELPVGREMRTFISTKFLLFDREGQPYALCCISTDITDRKQAEKTLRESQQFIETVLNTIPISVFWKNQESVFLGCNQQFAKGFNLQSPAEIQGKTDFDLVVKDAHLYRADDLWVMERGEAKLGIEETFTLDTGEQRWLETHKAPLRDWAGNVVGVVGTFQDITDRKLAAIQLQESEAKFRNLVENANDIIYTLSSEGIFTYVSPNWTELLGHEVGEVLNQSFVPFVHPEDVPKCVEFLKRIVESGMKQRGVEYRVQHKNGEWRWHTSSAAPQRDAQGAIVAYLGIAHDVTDRKHYEAQLHQTNEELARATRLKDEFLANMSHELRTPLNAILGLTEGLQDQAFGMLNSEQRQALQTIERSGSHLLELINDILDVAKIESGQIELTCVPTSVTVLCQSSLAFIKQQAQKKRIQLKMILPRDLPDLLVDERRIRQVLINLLNNAVKFTPDNGQVTLEVSPTIARDGASTTAQNLLRITVADTGIGIAPEHFDRLFQPFTQIDSALNRQYTGTGLGLTLVKRLVELHGGQVSVTSQVGVGSCFTIELPYASTQSQCLECDSGRSVTLESDLTSLDLSPLILLVEDNEANITTTSSYLSAKGYRVVLATDGYAAIEQVQAQRPDLIVMDIQMPGMDGLEAIQTIRQNPNLVDVPIIAMTALTMRGDRERCLAAGANEYLAKPVRLKQLVQVIRTLLSG